MSDTLLSGDFTVYYLDENRQKRITWSGSATGTRTMNELYSASQDLFDESLQMDDGTPMSAETPVEYTIGIIDAGDLDPWYIDYETMQHMTGGALRTASWARVQDSNTGIVVVAVTSSTFDSAAIGQTVTHDVDSDSGTLLDIIEAGATDYIVIRPASDAAANNWDSTSGGITCSAVSPNQTATQAAAAVTGEQIWTNLYSIGTIEADTHIYVYQGAVDGAARARVYDITDSTQDWWSDGHIDRCYYIKDYTTASFPVIDGGYLKVFARKFGTLYDNFEVATSTTSGGRNPIPLATAPDLDNTTGYKSITTTAVAADDFSVGDEIQGATSGARGIITSISGSSPTYTFHYYLIDDPLTDFQTAAETINNVDSTASPQGEATKDGNAPSDQGPASSSWFTGGNSPPFPTVTYANTTVDINDDGTAEGYGITLNCNNNPLTEVYEWTKYVFRRGNTATGSSDGIEAEQYVGAEVFLKYSGSVTGTIDEGDGVTQETSNATGIVISHDTTNKEILLRDTRGTFTTHATTATLSTTDSPSGSVEIDTTAATFSPKKAAPLGTFAGGTFFGARGVVLSNWATADENSFQLTDSAGNIRTRPVAITLTVTNLVGGAESATDSDTVSVWRLTGSGGSIDKTEYSAAGGEAIGASTLVVDTAITTDTPGKTTGGVLHVRDASNNNQQYRLRYSSWATSTFTLANVVITAEGGTDTNTIVDTGQFANAKRGDLVLNTTRSNAISYITQVVDNDTAEISPAISGQTTGDSIELNAIPVAINTADDVYVALIDQYATTTSAAVSIVYQSTLDYRVVVRNQRNATKIKPFTTDDQTTGSDRSVATIRTTDTIAA